MAKVLRINAPASIFFLVAFEAVLLLLSFYFGLYMSWVDFRANLAQIFFYLPKAVLYVSIVTVSMFAFGLYRRDGIFRGSVVVPRLLVAFLFALILMAFLFYSFPILKIWRAVLVFAMPAAFFCILANRVLARGAIDADVLKRRIAVIGSGEQAARIEAMHGGQFAGFVCQGYIRVDSEAVVVAKARLLPATNDLPTMLKTQGVEQLVIATTRLQDLPTRALVDCRLQGIRILDYQAFHSEETGRVDLDFLTPEWFFVEEGFHTTLVYRWLKRTSDVVLSAFLMLLMLPLFLLIGIGVRLDGGGRAVFRQERVGLGGAPFSLLKFRSMHPDAESDGVPRWSGNGDPRVTRLGRLLRRTRLDELPQVWNILKGEMSFVGPRPERPYFVDRLSEAFPYFPDRHAVKPGLTGWAQINLPYSNSDDEARKKLEYDLYYIKYGNVLMDLVIMLQTMRVVFWPESARSS